ncbi:hypothetical protein [Ancylobacter sp. FA202]|uniref:hypothetical protein n=1 Tax=Ancylobacter sp. FA202 TaxID=1111106 RepID=UPI00036F91BE|nr:hypothetical protein [Ancylobacter sp. FA202]
MRALISHLPDFSSAAVARTPAWPVLRPGEAGHALLASPPPEAAAKPGASAAPAAPAPDLKAMLLEAEEAGRQAGEAAARARFDQQRAEDAALAQEQLAQARQNWAEAEGEPLARAVTEGFEQLGEELSSRLGRVIGPFLSAALRERVLADMAAAITRALADSTAPLLRVTGPADLIESLQARLDPRAPLCFEADAGAEIVVTAGATTFETQLRAWAERLDLARE